MFTIITPNRVIGLIIIVIIGVVIYNSMTQKLEEAGPFPTPIQNDIEPHRLLSPEGYTITGLAEYSLTAMVMSRSNYHVGREADLSQMDLVLAWGPLTQEPWLSKVKYWQDNRWYFYKWKEDELENAIETIKNNSANNHIIIEPGNPDIADVMLSVRKGDVVDLKGYLVRVEGAGGWHWKSSLRRTDTGDHSCELFYVTSGSIVDK